MQYIYTRPTETITAKAQNERIVEHFKSEWSDTSIIVFYGENRLKTSKFEQMLSLIGYGDVVYCYNPAVFGIGVGVCAENIAKLLDKGARIESVVCGTIDYAWIDKLRVAGDIVRECCAIERTREIAHNKGVREVSGGYFDEDTGQWRQGRKKVYEPPHWAFIGQRNADEARFARESSAARRWIDMKIMEAWTTEKIWKEYRCLCDVMEENVWERVGKQWINVRRLELTR